MWWLVALLSLGYSSFAAASGFGPFTCSTECVAPVGAGVTCAAVQRLEAFYVSCSVECDPARSVYGLPGGNGPPPIDLDPNANNCVHQCDPWPGHVARCEPISEVFIDFVGGKSILDHANCVGSGCSYAVVKP
jgi:hypothetical protein